jgi:hypothetical protein
MINLYLGVPKSIIKTRVSIVVVATAVRALRTMCGLRTAGWSLPCVMSD